MKNQAWISGPIADGIFILSPAFLTAGAIFLFPAFFSENEVPPIAWFLLVVGVDVAHVYSTLYRTYFDSQAREKYSFLLLAIPILCFSAGFLLCVYDPSWFWRCVAYLAVFHFVRQQYGFMSVYSRKEVNTASWMRLFDAAAIYSATLYPLVFWHVKGRDFHWMLEGDFFRITWKGAERLAFFIWMATLLIWAGKEAFLFLRFKLINLPKILLISGTAISWYTGIVMYNGDMAFTLTNVLSHGIPYMALIWFFGRRQNREKSLSWIFSGFALPLFFGILFLFAWTEEALWDAWIWRDHLQFYPIFGRMAPVQDKLLTSFVMALLATPQLTHYVLDGFIWKVRRDGAEIPLVLDGGGEDKS